MAQLRFFLPVHELLGLPGPLGWMRLLRVHGFRSSSPKSEPLPSRKLCSVILEFWHAQEGSDHDDGVDHRKDQTRVYAGVPEALPR